jgi:hypothetical protein
MNVTQTPNSTVLKVKDALGQDVGFRLTVAEDGSMESNESVNGGEFHAARLSREDAPWYLLEIRSLAIYTDNDAANDEARRLLEAHYPMNEG